MDACLAELDPLSAEVVRVRHGIGYPRACGFQNVAGQLGISLAEATRRYHEAVADLKGEAAAGTLAV